MRKDSFWSFLPAPQQMEFPGQGSDPSCRWICGNAVCFNLAGGLNLCPDAADTPPTPLCPSGNLLSKGLRAGSRVNIWEGTFEIKEGETQDRRQGHSLLAAWLEGGKEERGGGQRAWRALGAAEGPWPLLWGQWGPPGVLGRGQHDLTGVRDSSRL